MPVSIPGFSSYSSFFSLFTPLKRDDPFFGFGKCEQTHLHNTWFNEQEYSDDRIPFTEDCLRCLKQVIRQYAEMKQHEYILAGLLKFLPHFPAELVAAAHSCYMALVHKRDIDIALLNSLGLVSAHLLAEGNAIAVMAAQVYKSIADYVGGNYLQQFLSHEENQPSGYLFTALAVLAITTKYWMTDNTLPQRQVLKIPAFLGSLMIRASYYWNKLGRMAQHSAQTCQMTTEKGEESYRCVKQEHPLAARVTQREDWLCSVSDDKSANTCDFSLSADLLKRTGEQGVVWQRFDMDESPQWEEPVATSSAARETAPLMGSATAALLLPVALSRSWKGAGIALGTTIAASAGYAWYAMSGRAHSPKEGGEWGLTAKERELITPLSDMFSSWDYSVTSPEPIVTEPPFSVAESSGLESLLSVLKSQLPIFAQPKRLKREVTQYQPSTVSRVEYWKARLKATPEDSPEHEVISQLATQAVKIMSFAAPKESFPALERWYTLMDHFNLTAFSSPYFFNKIEDLAGEIARSSIADYPDGKYSADKWLHLGLFWQALYLRLVEQWGEVIRRLDAPMACEYKIALEQVSGIINLLFANNVAEYNLSGFSGQPMADLLVKVDFLRSLHEKLLRFNVAQKKRIAEKITEVKGLSLQGNESYPQYKNQLTYMDRIDLSPYTMSFAFELVTLINNVFSLQLSEYKLSGKMNPAMLNAELSLVASTRLLDALKGDEIEKAYNYARFDETIISQMLTEFAQHWEEQPFVNFMDKHTAIYETIWQEYQKMQGRLSAPVTTAAATTNNTNIVLPEIFRGVNWSAILHNQDQHQEKLPENRQTVSDFLTSVLLNKISDFMQRMTELARAEIFSPASYVNEWIKKTVQNAGMSDRLTPETLITVTGYRHVFSKGMTSDSNNETYTLRDIVRGMFRREDQHTYTVRWPQFVSAELREKFLNDAIENDIRKDIDKVFDNDELVNVYRIMSHRAAFNYLSIKNQVLGNNNGCYTYSQQVYLDCVRGFVEGRIKPQVLFWHNQCLPGIIFIPAGNTSALKFTRGVLLSIWDNDYFEIPYPGFAVSQLKKEGEQTPPLCVEQSKSFQDFINKHSVPRIAKALSTVTKPFGYREIKSVRRVYFVYTDYHAPFIVKSIDNTLEYLIKTQRDDLIDLYDDFMESKSEYIRQQLHELFNVMAFSASLILLGSGLMLGGPGWVYIVASMASTLLLEVVPNTVLYHMADDDNERQRYLHALVMAIASEAISGLPATIAGKIIRNVSFRMLRMGLKVTNKALQPLASMTEATLKNIANNLHVERLRVVAERVHFITPVVREQFASVIKVLNEELANTLIATARRKAKSGEKTEKAQFSKTQQDIPDNTKASGSTVNEGESQVVFPQHSMAVEADIWFDARYRLAEHYVLSWYRAVLRWSKTEPEQVNIEYMVVAKEKDQVVVLTKLPQQLSNVFIYTAETEWVESVHEAAKKTDILVKYIDFDDFDLFEIQYPNIADLHATVPPDQYIGGALTLFAPKTYREMVKLRTGIGYEDIQNALGKLKSIKLNKQKEAFSGGQGTSVAGTKREMMAIEPIRRLPQGTVKKFSQTMDFNAEEIIKAFKKKINYKEGTFLTYDRIRLLLLPLDAFIMARGFSNTRFRRVMLWKSIKSAPEHHFVAVGVKNNIEYIFDIFSTQIKNKIIKSTPSVIMREVDWAASYNEAAKNYLIKYKDFDNQPAATRFFKDTFSLPTKLIEGATMLSIPEWYLSFHNAIVEMLIELPELPSLSKFLQQRMEQGYPEPEWQSALNFDLQQEPVLLNEQHAKIIDSIKNIGEDIKKFFPIPSDLFVGVSKVRHKIYTKKIKESKNYRIAAKNLPTLKATKNLSLFIATAVAKIEEGFITAHGFMEKMVALMQAATTDVKIKTRIIERLAKFLNEHNIDIIAEAYSRFDAIVEHTHKMTHFHVVEKKLSRVIPMHLRDNVEGPDALSSGFTYSGDPSARIMVILDNFQYYRLANSALHEITHLAFGSLDFFYMNSVMDSFDSVAVTEELITEAHKLFGTRLFYDAGLQFGLGKEQLGAVFLLSEEKLSPVEKALAHARLAKLPRLRANGKLNNADSVVILMRDMLSQFKFTQLANGQWQIDLVLKGETARVKRDVSSSDNIEHEINAILYDDILSLIIFQSLSLPSENIVADAELSEPDFALDTP